MEKVHPPLESGGSLFEICSDSLAFCFRSLNRFNFEGPYEPVYEKTDSSLPNVTHCVLTSGGEFISI